MASPLITLQYASVEDVAQDLAMVIQSCGQDEWVWEASTEQEREAWVSFVQDPTSTDAATLAGLAGRLQVSPRLALSYTFLSSGKAGVDVSAPTLPSVTVSAIKTALTKRLEEWPSEGIESLFLFDLLATAQTLVADLKESSPQPASITTFQPDAEDRRKESTEVELSRVLFWSHHLKAPSKLKDFNNWCPELRIWGIVRAGYPGYLCFEGDKAGVDEMVRRVKGLQWHAIQLRVQKDWIWVDKRGATQINDAILSCALARGHPDNTYGETKGEVGGKVRTGCEVIEDLGTLVERLKACRLGQDEISEALGIKVTGSQEKI